MFIDLHPGLTATTMMRSATILLLALALSLAGCAGTSGDAVELGGPGTGSAPPPPPPASTPEADEETGSIGGTVIDEEALPLVGVEVSIVETLASTQTDSEGQFTFNQLEAGNYRLVLTRVGYIDAALSLKVTAGEVTEATITMRPVPVNIDPYHVSVPNTAHIHASWVFLTTFGGMANATGATSNLCDPCRFHIPVEPDVVDGLAEAWWDGGSTGINEEIFLQYYVGEDYSDASRGTVVETGYVQNRGALILPPDPIEPFEEVRLYVHGGFYTVNIDHKPEVWTTFAYVEELPAEFTALPPE